MLTPTPCSKLLKAPLLWLSIKSTELRATHHLAPNFISLDLPPVDSLSNPNQSLRCPIPPAEMGLLSEKVASTILASFGEMVFKGGSPTLGHSKPSQGVHRQEVLQRNRFEILFPFPLFPPLPENVPQHLSFPTSLFTTVLSLCRRKTNFSVVQNLAMVQCPKVSRQTLRTI